MRHAISAAFLGAIGMPAASASADQTDACALTLAGAHVFTGSEFEVRDVGVRDGRFVASDPASPRIDASRLWLIPPFVDAHTHAIDTPRPDSADAHRRWLAEGVFYALNPNNVRSPGPTGPARDDQVDFEAAGGGLTRPGGHPTALYAPDMDGRGFHGVADPDAARVAVARVKANGGGFVKLYLLNHRGAGGGDGLSAASFEAAVAEAKRLGLRTIVHIEDAEDFRLAVAARVFAIVHMPYWPPSIQPRRAAAELMIDHAAADAAAAAQIIVVPTVILSLAQFDGAALAEIMAVERHNLGLLRDAGVRIAVGEDFIGGMHDEIAALRSFALFDSVEMLRMATRNGAELAFPDRRLGQLADGHEASFLVYRRNPLNNWIDARRPAAGMRAGRILIDEDGLLANACSGTARNSG